MLSSERRGGGMQDEREWVSLVLFCIMGTSLTLHTYNLCFGQRVVCVFFFQFEGDGLDF